MAVKARFWISELTKHGNTDNMTVLMKPVVRSTGQAGDGQNTDWSKYTPSGEIRLSVTAQGAQEWFEARLGKDIAITLEDVED